MSVNVQDIHEDKHIETANVAAIFGRTADFQKGSPLVTFTVTIKYGDTVWLTDKSGNIVGIDPSSPKNVIEYKLLGQEYYDFATRRLTDAEKNMCVGELIPKWLDEAIQLHIESLKPKS